MKKEEPEAHGSPGRRRVVAVHLRGKIASVKSVPGSLFWSGGGEAGLGLLRLGQEPWISKQEKSAKQED